MDLMGLFIADVKKNYPDLTHDQCAELAKIRDENLVKARAFNNAALASSDKDEVELHLKEAMVCKQEAARATNLLVYQGLPWAINCSKKFYVHGRADDHVDLITNICLKCAKVFDPTRGHLSTLISKVVLHERLHIIKVAGKWKHSSIDTDEHDVADTRESEKLKNQFNELQYVHYLIRKLPERSAIVLEMLMSNSTLDGVGRIIGVSSEQVRRLRDIAIDEMRTLLKRYPYKSTIDMLGDAEYAIDSTTVLDRLSEVGLEADLRKLDSDFAKATIAYHDRRKHLLQLLRVVRISGRSDAAKVTMVDRITEYLIENGQSITRNIVKGIHANQGLVNAALKGSPVFEKVKHGVWKLREGYK